MQCGVVEGYIFSSLPQRFSFSLALRAYYISKARADVVANMKRATIKRTTKPQPKGGAVKVDDTTISAQLLQSPPPPTAAGFDDDAAAEAAIAAAAAAAAAAVTSEVGGGGGSSSGGKPQQRRKNAATAVVVVPKDDGGGDSDDDNGDSDDASPLTELARARIILQLRQIYMDTMTMLDRRGVGYETRAHPAARVTQPATTPDEQIAVATEFESAVITNSMPAMLTPGATQVPSTCLLMSRMIPRGDGGIALVFFAERGTVKDKRGVIVAKKLVPTKLIDAFLNVLVIVTTEGYNVTDVIIVSPTPIALARTGFSTTVKLFVQVFTTAELAVRVGGTVLSSRIVKIIRADEIATTPETKHLDIRTLQPILARDPEMKYHGIRPGSVVLIERPPVHAMAMVPGGITIRRVIAG